MTEVTEFIGKTDVKEAKESGVAGLSVRALLALIVTAAICVMSVMGLEVREPLYTMGGMMIAFYFAQNQKPKVQG